MKLSGELDYRIRYDVEHNLFHVKNVFNDEYITPTFIEYVQKLEKENAELKHQLKHRNCLDCSNHSSNLRIRNLELEKENAELKEALKTYNGCGDWDNDFHTCRVYLQHEELQMYIEQLTKAKELLAKWVELFIPKLEGFPKIPIQVDTEQFLKEAK